MEKSSMSKRNVIVLSQPAPVDMADEWYEFATEHHFWMQWRLTRILSSRGLKQVPEGRWLDIGCGHGEVIKQLESKSDYIVDGTDLNLMALEQVGSTRGDIFVYNIFDNHEPFKNKYAVILLLDVIEHIDDASSFLAASLTSLKPGGLVIINVPALSFLFSRYDVAAGNKRRYTKKMLRALFKENGVEELEMVFWGVSLIPIAIVRKFVLLFVSRKNIIKRGFRPPSPTINRLFIILMKVELFLFGNPVLGTSIIAIGRRSLK
jgi:2-polyprenyl-3-methyl-5-hydroxy-6-metoxy-1,4-benzoquinol methylase